MNTLLIILVLIFFYSFLKLLKGANWSIKKFLNTDLNKCKDYGEALIFVCGILVIVALILFYIAYLLLKYAP
jgi:hypothetical protein